MMEIVPLEVAYCPDEFVELNTTTGEFAATSEKHRTPRGNYMRIEGQDIAVFAADRQLFLQWGRRRWRFDDPGEASYFHDFVDGSTTFSIDDSVVHYRAWWVGDPTFEPGVPERDEQEDDFAYLANLIKDGELQRALIDSWST